MPALSRTPVRIAAIVALLVVVVLGQNAAAALAPSGASAQTGRLICRAGFAYLSGIRTFAAALLWNRLDPQYHLYYGEKSLAEHTQMLPTVRLVQTLDPQFVQSYYNAAWIIAKRGDFKTAFDVAKEGVRNNPRSGLLRASLIQLMLYEDKEKYSEEVAAQADAGTGADMVWLDDAEKFEGYAVFAAAYGIAGQTEKEAAARTVMESLRGSATSGSVGDAGHDHDGDGKPDH